jgi:hypothetical protein
MAPKEDIKQVNAIAKEFNMTQPQREEFGFFLEQCKTEGYRGTKNERGDFTYQELRQMAKEYLGIQ